MRSSRPPLPRPRFPPAEVDLSVALATYNGERWIGSFLDSLLSQERFPDELVIQDDASTDGSVSLIREFASSAPFDVRIEVNEHRVGSTANFALTLGRCRGRFIALADQDDVWYPAKLRRLIDELSTDPTITMVFSDADLIDESGAPLGRRLWSTRRVAGALRHREVVPEELFAKRALTTGCTMAVRRRAVAAALPFPVELDDPVAPMRHDRWLSMISAAVGTVRSLPEPLLGFRVHPSQETGVLVGSQLTRAFGRATAGVLTAPLDQGVAAHLIRAAQLETAADRVDDLGGFEEAATLRAVAAHHRLRAHRPDGPRDRVRQVVDGAQCGAYSRDALGAAAMTADVIRALRPGHAPSER